MYALVLLQTDLVSFQYDFDAVRVVAKRINRHGEEEKRKFSVDPNLTSYEILRSILARAFDVKSVVTEESTSVEFQVGQILVKRNPSSRLTVRRPLLVSSYPKNTKKSSRVNHCMWK